MTQSTAGNDSHWDDFANPEYRKQRRRRMMLTDLARISRLRGQFHHHFGQTATVPATLTVRWESAWECALEEWPPSEREEVLDQINRSYAVGLAHEDRNHGRPACRFCSIAYLMDDLCG